MDEDSTEKSKNKVLLWVVSGIAVMTFSAILTFLGLSYIYRAQPELASTDSSSKGTRSVDDSFVDLRTVKAASYKDFSSVCSGFKVTNAPKFKTKSEAVIATFTQSPRAADTWLYEPVGYGQPFINGSEYLKIDTVACLTELRDGRTLQKTCTYPHDNETIHAKYYSLRYKLAYFEANTGKRIADGGVIETPTDICPAFAAYDQQTLSIYASPDAKVLEVSHANFTSR